MNNANCPSRLHDPRAVQDHFQFGWTGFTIGWCRITLSRASVCIPYGWCGKPADTLAGQVPDEECGANSNASPFRACTCMLRRTRCRSSTGPFRMTTGRSSVRRILKLIDVLLLAAVCSTGIAVGKFSVWKRRCSIFRHRGRRVYGERDVQTCCMSSKCRFVIVDCC
jgi:hypothetical protein